MEELYMTISIKTDEYGNSICYIKDYIPFSDTKAHNMRPYPDTRLIMDVKAQKEYAISYFHKLLEPIVEKGAAISYIPSHDPTKTSTGILSIAKRLIANDRVDATSCIKKLYPTNEMHNGGSRERHVLLPSFGIVNSELISGKEVYLLDDIHTSGTSMDVCKDNLAKRAPIRLLVWY